MKAKSEPWQKYDLPSPNTTRWVASRKTAVVNALKSDLVTRDYIMQLYILSNEELHGWIKSYERDGQKALRINSIQTNRRNTQ